MIITPVNLAEAKENPEPEKSLFGPSDYHKKINDHLLSIGMHPSEIPYNSEGHPIVAYNADGSILPLKAEGLAKDVNKLRLEKDVGAKNNNKLSVSSIQNAAKLNAIEKKIHNKRIKDIESDSDTEFRKYKDIPYAPDGVSVDKNISDAEEFKKSISKLNIIDRYNKTKDFMYERFPSGKEMDYKRIDRNHERFGNFNYGAVASAVGIPEFVGKIAAGLIQVKSGTAKMEWLPTNFDDPKDQWDIEQGYKYYEKKNTQK